MRKFSLIKIITIITFVGTFLSLFVYFYKTSGKFRKSVASALLVIVMLSSQPLESEAKDADAFTPQQQTIHTIKNRDRVTSAGAARIPSKGGPDDPGSGGNDDENGIPEFPKLESVQETENRIDNIDAYIAQMTKISESANEEDQCPIHEQNKAGIDELPNSSKYIYTLETKTAKKALKKVWKNTNAQKEVLEALSKIDKGKLLPRNQKDFKGFKSLKELKFSKTRILMQPGKDGEPDKIVLICMRSDLDDLVPKLRKKYK